VDTLTDVVVPDIGEFADVPVIEVLVAVGDPVAVEDPLVVLESDKATMEIPAPSAGIVRELLLSVGDRVSEGTPIARLEVSANGTAAAPDGAEVPAAAAGGEAPAAAAGGEAPAPAAQAPAEPNGARAAVTNEPAASATSTPAPPATDAGAAPVTSGDGDSSPSVYAGPATRRRARELGIDLRTVAGTGRRGRITLEDLDRALAEPSPTAAGGGEVLGLAPWPSVDFARFGEIERVPLSRIQKLSAANLARNWVRIPHVTHNEEADITELEAFRGELNAEQSEVKVTMVALLLKAVASALEAFPRFNSSLDGEELVLKRYRHLGFAADTPQGLVVPVVRDVDRKGLLEIAAELMELSEKARAGRLSPAEMSGSTFTISSLGGIGGTSFTPIINAPEVAILGVVRSSTRPVWDGERFEPRLILPLSLSYDHRVIDGAAAARFCVHLKALLADMRRILL
jgi:pyruvate dehydrogenase E2 component (dihydrolipoamide acetyltransferase)